MELDWLTLRIRDCCELHQHCTVLEPEKEECHRLPTRIIDVRVNGPSHKLCLVESAGAFGTYIALSYCWGSSQPFTTQKATYYQRLEGFDIAELPATI